MAAACLAAAQAQASDLDGVYVDDANFLEKPAELGSGWYIRGDIGININGHQDVSVSGNPVDPDPDTIFSINNITDKGHFDVGFGYRFNSRLRVDAIAGRLAGTDHSTSKLMFEQGTEPLGTPADLIVAPNDPNPCNGWGTFTAVDGDGNQYLYIGDDFITNCIREDTVEYDVVYAMANAYVDLGSWHGFTPYVGGGLGVGRLSWREEIGAVTCVPRPADVREEGCQAFGVNEQAGENELFRQTGTISQGVDYRLGYAFIAGFGYDITPNTTLDFAYKYMNFGAKILSTGNTSGSVLSANGYGTHQVNVGLRYSIW